MGKKNNLGEIKSFVLLQVLSVMLGEQIYVFCSDDKNARNGAASFEGGYIAYNENKRSVTQNEFIKNTSHRNHRI